jgi:phosphoribosylanthranilate isomerase
MTKIKICGLKDKTDAIFAASLGVDYLGMIFVENVKRKVAFAQAQNIVNSLDEIKDKPKLVGLFADQPLDYVKNTFSKFSLDYVQLCGDENFNYLTDLDLPFIKQIKISENIKLTDVFHCIEKIQSIGGLISIDSYMKGHYGGSGKLINLSNAKKIIQKYNVLLAGGLNTENIQRITEDLCPWGVDVSSGVESNEIKDKDKIESFILSVKGVKY